MRSVAKKKSKSKSGAVGGALGRGLTAIWRFIAKILGNSVRFIARGARDLDPAHQRDGIAFLILILALVATAGTWFHADNIVGRAVYAFVYVDGQSIGDITETSLKDRRILGEEGFISVIVVIDSQSGKIVAGPDIHARGFNEDMALFDDVKLKIEKALAAAVAEGINGTHQLSQIVRKTVGGWVGGEHRRKPMIVPVVIEV